MGQPSEPESREHPKGTKQPVPGPLAIIGALALVAWFAIGALAYLASHRLEAAIEIITRISPSGGSRDDGIPRPPMTQEASPSGR